MILSPSTNREESNFDDIFSDILCRHLYDISYIQVYIHKEHSAVICNALYILELRVFKETLVISFQIVKNA